MNVAFVIGRFQPVHKGHLELLKACSGFDKIIIMFGSSNESRTKKNPLTFEERAVLMTAALPTDISKKAVAVPLADHESWITWIGLVKDNLRQFTKEGDKITFVAFNKDESTTEMNKFVEDNGFELLSVCPKEKTHFGNATDIRAQLANGVLPEDIEQLHESTQKLIKEFELQNVFSQST